MIGQARPVLYAATCNASALATSRPTSAYGALWAQAELRKSLGAAGARVVAGELAVARAQDRRAGDDLLLDRRHRERLAEILRELAAAAAVLPAAA